MEIHTFDRRLSPHFGQINAFWSKLNDFFFKNRPTFIFFAL